MLREVKQLEDHADLLIDGRTGRTINDPDVADDIARGLFILQAAIERGPDGAKEASAAILANIEAAYLHTKAHRAALNLYLLWLTGQLPPEDEPLQLINGAIERGIAQSKLMKQSREKRRRKQAR